MNPIRFLVASACALVALFAVASAPPASADPGPLPITTCPVGPGAPPCHSYQDRTATVKLPTSWTTLTMNNGQMHFYGDGVQLKWGDSSINRRTQFRFIRCSDFAQLDLMTFEPHQQGPEHEPNLAVPRGNCFVIQGRVAPGYAAQADFHDLKVFARIH